MRSSFCANLWRFKCSIQFITKVYCGIINHVQIANEVLNSVFAKDIHSFSCSSRHALSLLYFATFSSAAFCSEACLCWFIADHLTTKWWLATIEFWQHSCNWFNRNCASLMIVKWLCHHAFEDLSTIVIHRVNDDVKSLNVWYFVILFDFCDHNRLIV